MRNVFYYGLIAVVFLVSGCAQAVRYSPYELKAFPTEVQEQIKQRAISLGMNHQQVRYSWGAPSKVKVLAPEKDGHVREEWVYKGFEPLPYKTTLTFTEAELTDIVSNDPNLEKHVTRKK
ncbi:MAG: hypothetical protein HY805_00605 [Nitrospirae bacterium]|nr:hypothetical protein [Nitrospirota bacterium]